MRPADSGWDASALAQLPVLDARGEPTRLGTVWAERPVVLALIRHFG